MKTCAIIGNPILKMGLYKGRYKNDDFKLLIEKSLSDLIENGVTEFICNTERGFALRTAEIIISMQGINKPKLHIISPFEEQSKKWSKSFRESYYNVHAQADTVKIMTTSYKEDCYRICDKAIIDKCDMLFTDNVDCFAAQYADTNNKPVIILKDLSYSR